MDSCGGVLISLSARKHAKASLTWQYDTSARTVWLGGSVGWGLAVDGIRTNPGMNLCDRSRGPLIWASKVASNPRFRIV